MVSTLWIFRHTSRPTTHTAQIETLRQTSRTSSFVSLRATAGASAAGPLCANCGGPGDTGDGIYDDGEWLLEVVSRAFLRTRLDIRLKNRYLNHIADYQLTITGGFTVFLVELAVMDKFA
jgi:hypothetical protein